MDVLKRFIPWKPLPSKRVYIPKPGKKKRPLGIPSIIDRCLQAVVKSALEPCWEAQFEGCSYGFRPGRSAHDAISKIYNVARPSSNKRWILDADISGCFDNIDHEHLMAQLKGFPARRLIYQWLKAGYLEKGKYMPTKAGTPQGGVISPLLANIALHGMEDALGVVKPTGTTVRTPRILVRYADDLVVFCRTEADARQAREELSVFLGKRGLELSNEKTSIVEIDTGFDFLGFNVRQYRDLPSKTGFKLLIKPSKKSIQTFKAKVRDVFLSCNGLNVTTLIGKVNPIVRGWCNYYRHVVSSEIFNKLNGFIYHRCYRYAKRQHPNKSHKWRRAKYWGQSKTDLIGKSFMDKATGSTMVKPSTHHIVRHVMVKGAHSPDDPSLKAYWEKRSRKLKPSSKPSLGKVAQRQDYRCPVCGELLFNDESLQLHHKIPKSKGGWDTYKNLVLLHLYCHQQVHANQSLMDGLSRVR